jgi:hypothetical protein
VPCRGRRRLRQPGAPRTAAVHDFLVPFEITSVLLLVAIVGAVVLGKRRI